MVCLYGSRRGLKIYLNYTIPTHFQLKTTQRYDSHITDIKKIREMM